MPTITERTHALLTHPCRMRMLSMLCAGIAATMVFMSNHANEEQIPPWAAAALGGFAAIIPRYEYTKKKH